MEIGVQPLRLISLASTTSTMIDARRLTEEGYPHAAIVRADTQTQGRGRIEDRRWFDAPGASLLMTLILPAEMGLPEALPLKAGLGVLRALRQASGRELLLKWPNDVVMPLEESEAPLRFAKICGILCESAGSRGLVGIGINIRKASCALVASGCPAISLEELCPQLPDAFSDLDRAALHVGSFILKAMEDADWMRFYEECMWGKGLRVRFLAGHPASGQYIEGILEGINPDGSVRIRTGEGDKPCRSYASGEISELRPALQSGLP